MPENQPPVTQRDIARKLGLSNATVSLALRDHPRIPEPRRREIQALAKKMGYRPNPAAATLSYQKRTTDRKAIHASIAWLNLWQDPAELRKVALFNEYWKGAAACAEKFGYRLEEFALAETSSSRIEKILTARGVDAVLIAPQHYRLGMELRDFSWEKFCAMRTSRLPVEPALHLVTTDQAANAMLACDKMLAKGYQRIGFINYARSSGDRIWRFESGFLTVQQELDEDARLPIYRLDAGDPASRAGLGEWIRRYRPDALLTLHADIQEIVETLGYRVPHDIGLATVNTLDCRITAGIDQTPAEIGRCAVLKLLSLLHDNERGIPENVRETLIKGRWTDGPTLPDRRATAR